MDRASLLGDIQSLQQDESESNFTRLAEKYHSRASRPEELEDELMQFTSYLDRPKVQPRDIKLELQPDFDLKRYQGLWYSAARIPQAFDQNTPWETAEYTLMQPKKRSDLVYIEVINTSYQEDGRVRGKIVGTAVMIDDSPSGQSSRTRSRTTNPAKLYVSFPTGQPMEEVQRANYLVHKTDYDRYAIVGSYDGSNLYILSRTRPLDEGTYSRILNYVDSLGYDISLLKVGYGAIGSSEGCIIL
uniref:Lipocalin/cytosolic fatty-acid binding domain-containing protein n=1 Tax=viral metagenome TaxID=1070528 RepID=A0A6C0CG49_9ZZZZ